MNLLGHMSQHYLGVEITLGMIHSFDLEVVYMQGLSHRIRLTCAVKREFTCRV